MTREGLEPSTPSFGGSGRSAPKQAVYQALLDFDGSGGLSHRVWTRIKKRRPHQCWHWVGQIDKDGYGRLSCRESSYAAHRLAWEFTFGKIPSGLHVLHTCDVRACCNPSHLYLGTHKQNMRDRLERGRTVVPVRMRGKWTGRHRLVKRS